MMRNRDIATSLLALLLTATPTRAQDATVDALPARLDLMFRAIDSDTTPGCVVGVARGTLPVLYRQYGVADLERPTANDTLTVFEAGSVSKQFVAAAVLLLSRDGKLALDDDMRRFLPEFPADGPRTTIRQLLSHQSGIRDYGDLLELGGWPRGARLDTPAEIVSLLARQSGRNFAPGAEYSYSNSNYVLAATIIARASGMSLADYTARAIFAPLGMTRTSWRDDHTRRVRGRAIGWTPDDAGAWKIDMPNEDIVGHAGLLTTIPDLLRWQAAFRSGAFGGARFADDMQRAGVLTNGRTTAYALGLEVTTERGLPTVSHGGWTAGYKSYVGRIPSHDVAVALLCNAGSLRTDELGPQLLAIADGATIAPGADTPPDLGPAAADAERVAIAGVYRNARTRQAVTVRAFRDGVTINTWVPFRAGGRDRFTSGDSTRVLRVRRLAHDSVVAFTIVTDGVDTVAFKRVGAWAPLRDELAAMAGAYVSADADATWHLTVTQDTLAVQRRPGQRDVLVPRYRGAFTVPSQGWLVTVQRDRRGRVSAVTVSLPRTRDVVFRRRVQAR